MIAVNIPLFHGTACYNLKSFIETGPKTYPQKHLDKRAFCTSISFQEASVFAFRKTPANDLSAIGIVLEFDPSNMFDKDFKRVVDTRAIRDEKEVAVFKTDRLKLVAYHVFENNKWIKKEIWKTD